MHEAEIALREAIQRIKPEFEQAVDQDEFLKALTMLTPLCPLIDDFFAKVRVL